MNETELHCEIHQNKHRRDKRHVVLSDDFDEESAYGII